MGAYISTIDFGNSRGHSISEIKLVEEVDSPSGEKEVLIPEDSNWLPNKKNELAYKIIYENALWPSKKQAAMSLIAFAAFAYLAYTTGPSFLHYAIIGRHDVPGIQAINVALAPKATEWVNIVLNFYVLNLVGYIGIVRYPNEYLLKKNNSVQTKIRRDAAKTTGSAFYAALASIPYGALVLAGGTILAFILQMTVFSAMQIVGATELISLATSLFLTAYKYFKRADQLKKDTVDDSWDQKIDALSDNPALLLDQAHSIQEEDLEEDSQDNLSKKIDAIPLLEKKKANSKVTYATYATLMGLFFIAAYGYLYLTKSAGINTIFGKDTLNGVGRWILGGFFFLPFAGFGLYSQWDTANTISSILDSLYQRARGQYQAPESQRWSNWLYVTRGALSAFVFAGYFFGYLSGAAAIALNKEGGLSGEFVGLLTCFGAMLFNGFGFYSVGKQLDWILTTLITYKPNEWRYAFSTSLVSGFFKRHKDDLEEKKISALPIFHS